MPSTIAPKPTWAIAMPATPRGRRPVRRRRRVGSASAATRVQQPSQPPTRTTSPMSVAHCQMSNAATTSDSSSGRRKRRVMSVSRARFQLTAAASPTSSASGAINGRNTALKYGGPTEILPRPTASANSGYRVPSNTAAADTDRNTLFSSRKPSRENSGNAPSDTSFGARHAYRVKAPPSTTTRNPRMNTPRAGSVAKACTLINTPERTRNVPSSDKENAMIASSTVQLFSRPRFSVTANE